VCCVSCYCALHTQRNRCDFMKSATIPSLRVDPKLRADAEEILCEGETLTGFVIQSLRDGIAYRRMQKEFIERGLASRDNALLTGEYFDVADVLNELDEMLVRVEDR
jgi:hypothetical protein